MARAERGSGGAAGQDVPNGPAEAVRATQRRILDTLLAILSLVGLVAIVVSILRAVQDPSWWPQTIAALSIYLVVCALAIFRGLDLRVRAWTFLLGAYVLGVVLMALFGLLGDGRLMLLMLPAIGMLLVNVRAGYLLGALSVAIYFSFAAAAALGWLDRWLIVRDNSLELGEWLFQGLVFALLLLLLVAMQSLISHAQGQALRQAQQAADDLRAAHARSQQQSQDLALQARLLEATLKISRDTSALLDLQELLQRATNLMVQELHVAGAAVYLLDTEAERQEPAAPGRQGQAIRLAASAGNLGEGEAGRSEVPDVVLLQVRARGNPEPIGLAQEDVALPLQVGERPIGVLHVRRATGTPVTALQSIADQLAVAIANARLFAATESSLRELHTLYQHYTGEAWVGTPQGHRPQSWQAPDAGRAVGGEVWRPVFDEARSAGRPVVKLVPEEDLYLLAVPLKLREVVVGVLGFCRPVAAGSWGAEHIASVEAVASRVALTAENLRLLDATRRRAAQGRLVEQIASQVQSSLDPDIILKTAVRELGRTMGARLVTIEIGPGVQ